MKNNLSKAIFLIVIDLAGVLLLLLFLTYHGMSHIFLLLLGSLFLCLSVFDSRTGRLSVIYTVMLALPDTRGKGRLNWLPVLLSVVLIAYSLPKLFEHGLVNEAQRLLIRSGIFPQITFWSAAVAGAIIVIAVYSVVSSRGKQ